MDPLKFEGRNGRSQYLFPGIFLVFLFDFHAMKIQISIEYLVLSIEKKGFKKFKVQSSKFKKFKVQN